MMVDLRNRSLGLLASLGLLRLLACGGDAAGTPAGATTVASSGTGGASSTVGTGGGGVSTTVGAGGGGASAGCMPPATTIPELSEPDPRRPWMGAVTVIPSTAVMGVPVAGWRVDGAAMPTPKPTTNYSVLDTRKLPNGKHALSLDIVGDGGAIKTVDTPFCVENGPPPMPPFQGKFVDVTEAAGLPKGPGPEDGVLFFHGAVAGDLDGDGDDDLFLWNFKTGQVYEQVAPFTFMPKGNVIPSVRTAAMADLDNDGDLDLVAAGQGLSIFENQGGALVNVTASAGTPLGNGAPWNGFMSVTVADLDQDGLLDVLATQMNCTSGANLVLRNEGAFHFADIAPQLALDHPDGTTWGFSADLLQDGSAMRVVLYYETWCKPGVVEYHHFIPGPDLPLPGNFVQKKLRGVSPMGSVWFDADGDGLLDHWLAAHVTSPLWRAPDFQTSIGAYVGIDTFVDAKSTPFAGWSMVLLDADLDGKPDVFVTHDEIKSDPTATADGAHDALFWQRETGELLDVAALAGLGDPHACRAAFGADLDRDGDTDLLVGCRGAFRMLRNDLVDPTPGRTLFLHGTVSNADGVHAIVTTPTGEQRMLSGSGQPFAGGVQRTSVRAPIGKLTVLWPSGIAQKIDVGSDPILHITEPAAASVTPRRVPAGGGQSVQVEVSPAALDDADAAVSVAVSSGAWSKPLAKDPDGIWRGTLSPPSSPETVVLTVTVGAQTLRVRPRVFVR